MKKLLLCLFALTVVGQSFATQNLVNVTLRVDTVLPGTPNAGLQMLFDPTATLYGNIIPSGSSHLWVGCNIPPDFYTLNFPFRIPANADPVCGTTNTVANGRSVTIQIPAGIYDYAIVFAQSFPTTQGIFTYFVHDASQRHLVVGNDFVFEVGKKYTFHAFSDNAGRQLLTLTIGDDAFPNAPGIPQNLTITPDPTGALTALISWTNPALTHGGETLTELTAIHVYHGDDLTSPIHIIANPTIGAVASHTINVPSAGNVNFVVRGINTAGRGFPARSAEHWVGPDVPSAPENLTFNITPGNVANLSWTAPTTGLNGGFFNPASLVFDIYMLPFGIRVATGHTETTFTDVIRMGGNISYRVVARSEYGAGGSIVSQAELLCITTSLFPWNESFEHNGTDIPACWTQEHIVGNVVRWTVTPSGFGNPGTTTEGSFKAVFSEMGGGANRGNRTKLIPPPFDLTGLTTPVLSFWHVQRPFTISQNILRVFYRTSSTDPWNLLADFTSEVPEWTERRFVLPYPSATYYVAFEGEFQWGEPIMIDQISIMEAPLVIDGSIVSLHGMPEAVVGVQFVYSVLVENMGGQTLSNYTLTLLDADNTVLATAVGKPIEAYGTRLVEILWTPETAGEITFRAVIDVPNDDNSANDTSSFMTVNVLPSNVFFSRQIGSGTAIHAGGTHLPDVPLNLNWNASKSQALYFAHELIGQPAAIRHIQYSHQAPLTPFTENVQVWIASTDQTRLEEWLPMENFMLVFDGTVNFLTTGTATIPLQTHYTYEGGNLVVMVSNNSSQTNNRRFHITTTPEFPNRSRAEHGMNAVEINTMPGRPVNFHPNTGILFGLEMASISGTITTDGTTPLEGALVEILGTNLYRISNADGNFAFDFLAPGNYRIAVSKVGHVEDTTTAETFTANSYTRNFEIPLLPKFTVSGQVVSNNFPAGLPDVEISLTGYAEFSTTTDASGNFEIQDVYGFRTYTLTASRPGFITYRTTITPIDNVVLNITCNQIPYTAGNIEAIIEDENVSLTWYMPGTFIERNYILDNGHAGRGFRSNAFFGNAMGNMFSVPGDTGYITSVDIFGLAGSNVDENKQVRVGIYNTFGELVHVSDPFIIPSNDWITVLLDNVPYADTFLVLVKWVATPGYTNLIGYDTTVSSDVHLSPWILTEAGAWFLFHEGLAGVPPGTFMIRPSTNIFRDGHTAPNPFDGEFQVFRLLENQENQPQSDWTLLANATTEPSFVDEAWSTLPAGVYRYAVVVRYANDHYAVPRFSNRLVKDMVVDFRVDISSTTNNPVTGATVTLTYIVPNYDLTHTTHTLISEADGVTFPNLWSGRYALNITFDGHSHYVDTVTVSISEQSYMAQLVEIIRAPFALEVTLSEPGSAILMWSTFVPFIDDMEGHVDFAITDIGDYTLHYPTNLGTFNFHLIDHPNRFAPHAFIVFNPFATTPPMINPAVFNPELVPFPRSGSRSLVSFAPAHNQYSMVRNQWLVLPTMRIYDGVHFSFWARSFVGLPEQIRVLVSTTGNQPADFTTLLSAGTYVDVPSVWTQFSYDLSAFAGQDIYLAIHAVSREGALALMIDDIAVDVAYDDNLGPYGGSPMSSGNYTVYLNGVEVASGVSIPVHTFRDLAIGVHTAGVRAVFASGASNISTISFEVLEEVSAIQIIEEETLFVYPNPVTNMLNIQTEQTILNITVLDQTGRIVATQYGNHRTIDLQSLPAGLYVVQIRTNIATTSIQIVKN